MTSLLTFPEGVKNKHIVKMQCNDSFIVDFSLIKPMNIEF